MRQNDRATKGEPQAWAYTALLSIDVHRSWVTSDAGAAPLTCRAWRSPSLKAWTGLHHSGNTCRTSGRHCVR